MSKQARLDLSDLLGFQKIRAAILRPVADPEDSRLQFILGQAWVAAVSLGCAVLVMGLLAYFKTGVYAVPWWLFLVVGGVMATAFLLKDEPDQFEFVDDLVEREMDLYAEMDRDLTSSLGEAAE